MGERTYTESQIEDEHVIIEVLLVPAVLSSREIGCRRAPKVRVNTLKVFSNIDRDKRYSWPEPNLDAVLLTTREGVESTSTRIEIPAVRTRTANLGTATLIEVEASITVRRDGRSANSPVSCQRQSDGEG